MVAWSEGKRADCQYNPALILSRQRYIRRGRARVDDCESNIEP